MFLIIYFFVFIIPMILLATWIAQKNHQKQREQMVSIYLSEQIHPK
jgi:hypothetical protein